MKILVTTYKHSINHALYQEVVNNKKIGLVLYCLEKQLTNQSFVGSIIFLHRELHPLNKKVRETTININEIDATVQVVVSPLTEIT